MINPITRTPDMTDEIEGWAGTPGSFYHKGSSVWALDEDGKVNRFYVNVQTGFVRSEGRHQHRTPQDELDANARLFANAKKLALLAQEVANVVIGESYDWNREQLARHREEGRSILSDIIGKTDNEQ